jgi:hypothetical protein
MGFASMYEDIADRRGDIGGEIKKISRSKWEPLCKPEERPRDLEQLFRELSNKQLDELKSMLIFSTTTKF